MAPLIPSMVAVLGVLTLLIHIVSARCECGYSVNRTTDPSYAVWTELLETDFLHASNLTAASIGWTPQAYNVTAKSSRGTYGKFANLSNVIANPVKNSWDWAGDAVNGGDPGLQIYVRSKIVDRMVSMGEIAAERTDMLYGSFRVGMKMTGVPGTCGAFFWFRNDTQEIDIEFLSRELNATSNLVNLVLQSPQSAAAGYDASHTSNYDIYPLPFRPDQAFHEYRFDWLPDRVSFYADGTWLKDMTVDLPNSPGHIVLNHWSNGDPKWSAGPPAKDALVTVSYVKAYFNSSNVERHKDYWLRCTSNQTATGSTNSSVCQIPDQTTPPDNAGPDGNKTAHTWFFSEDPEESSNQTVYSSWQNHSGVGMIKSSLRTVIVSAALASVMALISLV